METNRGLPIALNDEIIERIPFVESGQKSVRDGKCRGLLVRITSRSKVFVGDFRHRGKERRLTIGKFGDYGIEDARIAYAERRKQFKQEIESDAKKPSQAPWANSGAQKNSTQDEVSQPDVSEIEARISELMAPYFRQCIAQALHEFGFELK